MIVMGIDVGISSIKGVLVEDNKILSKKLLTSLEETPVLSRMIMEMALEEAGLVESDIDMIVSTGMGAKEVTFANKNVTETQAIAYGAQLFFPDLKTVLCMGAEKYIAVSCREGEVASYATNDKCGSGSGSFLEVVASVLEVNIEDLELLYAQSENPVEISARCAVFEESEVVGYIHRGVGRPDIVRGVLEAVAGNMASVVNRVGVGSELVLVGGVAKNFGVVDAVARRLGVTVLVPDDPEFVPAIGAASIAIDTETGRGI